MKFTQLPVLLAALSLTAASSQAQTATRVYRSVDAYGNVVTQTLQIPLAQASGIGGLIANQGIRGSNTTSSSFTYSQNYGPVNGGYYPPGYVLPQGYGYPYPYPTAAGVVNNYYPQQGYNVQIGQQPYNWSRPNNATVIPLNNGYPTNNGYGYGYPGYYPPIDPYAYPAPIYNGTYYDGIGTGSIITQSQSSGSSISIGNGGIRGSYNNNRNSSSTTVTQRDNPLNRSKQLQGLPLLPPGVRPNLILPR
jgi:hypothetical protein